MSTTVNPVQNTQSNGELVSIMSPEMLIRQRLEEERQRLEKEAGIERKEVHHFHKPIELPFTSLQRDHTTILFGGLTWKHERLVHAALESLGYRCESVPVPNKKAFQLGKEYGNNGQCNPTYFTVGNLVQFVQDLEAKGLTKDEICDRYVFFTAGACGPCRFGMYEAEYRLALRNAGFDKFRVLLFQQSGGLNQAEAEAGLEMNLDFFLAILNALNIGDIINDVAYQIRPYEVNAGETDRVLEESMEMLHEVMRRRQPWTAATARSRRLPQEDALRRHRGIPRQVPQPALRRRPDGRPARSARPLRRHPDRPHPREAHRQDHRRILGPDHRGRRQLQHVPLPRKGRRAGRGRADRHLDLLPDAPGRAASYHDQKGLDEGAAPPPSWRLDKRLQDQPDACARRSCSSRSPRTSSSASTTASSTRSAASATTWSTSTSCSASATPTTTRARRAAKATSKSPRTSTTRNKGLAHMVLALKPFGCMPSTQSDGAQSAVMSHYKDMIFLPIETSGEGDVNAHSRVQMALGEAKAKTKLEFKAALDATGTHARRDSRLRRRASRTEVAHVQSPARPRVSWALAANFVRHVAERDEGETDRSAAQSSSASVAA